MDIRNAIVTTPGRTRIVHPLADPKKIHPSFLDPDFFVEVKEESNTATARRWDLFKFNPNNPKDKRYAEKQMKVAERSVQDLVVNFGGLFNNGEPIACDENGRALLTRVSVEVFAEDEDEDEKNDLEKAREEKVKAAQIVDADEAEEEAALDLEDRDTTWKSLWVLTQEAIDEQKKEEAKNSTRS